jgi:hypothetical protein
MAVTARAARTMGRAQKSADHQGRRLRAVPVPAVVAEDSVADHHCLVPPSILLLLLLPVAAVDNRAAAVLPLHYSLHSGVFAAAAAMDCRDVSRRGGADYYCGCFDCCRPVSGLLLLPHEPPRLQRRSVSSTSIAMPPPIPNRQ